MRAWIFIFTGFLSYSAFGAIYCDDWGALKELNKKDITIQSFISLGDCRNFLYTKVRGNFYCDEWGALKKLKGSDTVKTFFTQDECLYFITNDAKIGDYHD